MPGSLSITPDSGRVRVFTCPACGETIALGCERCRFCSIVIDQGQAQKAADLMDRINLACSEADEIRALLGNEESMFDISPVRSRNRIDLYLVPIMLLRWWIRFGTLRAEDKDLISARKDLTQYSWIALVVFAALVVAVIYLAEHH